MDNIDNVFCAIEKLYNQQPSQVDSAVQEQASKWLEEFQKSIHAWTISDQILHQKRDLNSCYFAAQTMRSKVLYSFHELPVDSYGSLRDSLVSHLQACRAGTDPAITKQLALAITDLALQMVSWKHSVLDLLNQLRPVTDADVLLTLLTFMPEEALSETLLLGANRRHGVIAEMAEQIYTIFRYLEEIATDIARQRQVSTVVQNGDSVIDDEQVLHKREMLLYKCLSAWFSLRIVVPAQPIANGITAPDAQPDEQIAKSVPTTLLSEAFRKLGLTETKDSLHEVLTDCVIQALQSVQPPNSAERQYFCEALYRLVRSLADPFLRFIAQEEHDKCLNLGRIFITLGETCLVSIVESPGQGLGHLEILDLILCAIKFHDYSIADMSFSWWYFFSEHIYQTNSPLLQDLFKSYIDQLVITLFTHIQIDSDFTGTPDQLGDTADFRWRAKECIKDVAFIAGSTDIFRKMFAHLQSLGSPPQWQEIEACMFLMTAVAKNIVPSEEEVVPEVLSFVIQLSSDNSHLSLRYTALELIAELDEWVAENPHRLNEVLTFVFCSAKSDKKLSSVAGRAVESIAKRCRAQLVPYLNDLFQFCVETDLPQSSVLAFLTAVSAILSRLDPVELTAKLRDLVYRQLQPLSELIKRNPDDSLSLDEAGQKGPIIYLDRLSIIFRNMQSYESSNGNIHPCLPVIEEMWPVLLETANYYKKYARVMERAFRAVRFTIRCVGPKIDSLLPGLVACMIAIYKEYPHSCCLYLGSILVDEYASMDAYVPGLLHVTEELLKTTFQLLEKNGLSQHPDTVDDMFRLVTRFVQKAPTKFLQWTHYSSLFQCAVSAIAIDHKEANESVGKFLSDSIAFLSCGEGDITSAPKSPDESLAREAALAALMTHGPALVNTILTAVVFHLPIAVVAYPAGVIWELGRFNRDLMHQWLNSAIDQLPKNRPGGAVNATDEQLNHFRSQIAAANDVHEITEHLIAFGRLYK